MELVYAAFLLCVEILIGFNTNSISLTSPESNRIVSLVVSVFNMTIGEGITVQVRITTADNSTHGKGNSIIIIIIIVPFDIICLQLHRITFPFQRF